MTFKYFSDSRVGLPIETPDRDHPGQSPQDRDPLDRDPWTESPPGQKPLDRESLGRDPPPPGRKMGSGTETPGRNMGPGSQTGSDIIQRPLPVDRQTPVKILPCFKLCLRVVIVATKPQIAT